LFATKQQQCGKIDCGLDRRHAKKAAKRLEVAAASGPTVSESAAESTDLEPTPSPPPVIDDAMLAGGDDDFEISSGGARKELSQGPFDEGNPTSRAAGLVGQNQPSFNSRGSPEGGAPQMMYFVSITSSSTLQLFFSYRCQPSINSRGSWKVVPTNDVLCVQYIFIYPLIGFPIHVPCFGLAVIILNVG